MSKKKALKAAFPHTIPIMTEAEQMITIGIVVFGTMLTRFLPFLVFGRGKETPKYIQYLGKILPTAVFGGSAFTSLEKTDAFVHCRRNCVLYVACAVSVLK